MASRTGTVLQEVTEEAVSQDATGERYHYLPWVDLICAGVPCQDVSVAGKRAGLAGARTGLFYDFARILQELRPTWFVFENVPGLLSSNRGRDFAEVLRVLMVECGYGVCWRVLNSQFFGVAQRRRRLFVVGRFGEPCPAEILFEPKSGTGNSQASGQARQDVARALANSSVSSGYRYDPSTEELIQVVGAISATDGGYSADRAASGHYVAATLREADGDHGRSRPRGDGCDNLVAATLSSGGHPGSNAPGRRREDDEDLVAAPITDSYWKQIDSSDRNGGPPNLVATLNSGVNSGGFRTEPGEHLVAFALRSDPGGTGQGHNTTYAVTENMRDRSQGPANYVCSETDSDGVRDFTGLPKGLDSARYRALGNAVTVQVAQWISERIVQVSR